MEFNAEDMDEWFGDDWDARDQFVTDIHNGYYS